MYTVSDTGVDILGMVYHYIIYHPHLATAKWGFPFLIPLITGTSLYIDGQWKDTMVLLLV